MTFQADIADDADLAINDGPLSIKHISRQNSGDAATAAFNALRRDVQKDDLAFDPALTKLDSTVFNLKASDVEFEPKQNDQILEVSSNQLWEVKSVGKLTLSTRYRCVCQKVRSNT